MPQGSECAGFSLTLRQIAAWSVTESGAKLEEELENVGLALYLQHRSEGGDGKRLSAGDFLAEIGMGEFAGQV